MADTPPLPPAGRTYRRLLRYAVPYRARLAAGIVFGILFAGSTTGMLFALRNFLAHIFDPAAADWGRVMLIASLLPVLGVFRGLGFYVSRYLIEWVGNRVVMDLRIALFDRLQDLSIDFFSSSRTGELISRTSNDTMLVERAVSQVMSDLVQQPFVLIGAMGYLFWLDPRLAAASVFVFPVCIIPIAIFGRRVRRFGREGQEMLADLVSLLQEVISGVRVVKAFGREDHERRRFNARSRLVFSRLMKVVRARASIEPIIVEIAILGLSMVLLYARWTGMTIGEFFTFAAALVVMYEPVKKLSRIHLTVQHSAAAADRVFEVLDAPVQVGNRPNATAFEPPIREVCFDHVGFAYDRNPVLHDIDFATPAGRCVALVGSSGSGKTTLVSLLPRFFDPTEGAIRINGLDIRRLTLASLRAQIGLVTQETFLFNETIAANIAYGRPDATIEHIRDAARRAHANGFIEFLPETYDTVVGERGVRLSGGQRQRLSIARAMLRDPPILILDEATSALDTESERQVQAAIDEVMTGRTVFVIAHRLSTIVRADVILVLDQGRIVETGTHAELLAMGGTYRRLHDLQFQI